jgi:Cysteine-rich secretory protein family
MLGARTIISSLLVVAACGGGTIGGGRDGGAGGPDATGAEAAYQLCVSKTNMLRATVGKSAVTRSAQLETYANAGAMYDYSHQAHDHFKQNPIGGGIAYAENECPHWDLSFGGGDEAQLVSACIDAFWSEGPGGGHYENMIGDYATLGCGLYHEGSDYTIVQDYGR